jgi:Concanavalin A-like lectin/glucanases superfamily
MVLLAHWPIDDGAYDQPTVTRDIAGGGSGAHDGVPDLSGASYGYGNYRAGGVGGRHMHKRGNSYMGSVRTIANPADFRLFGALTASAWLAPDGYYHWYTYSRAIVSCTGLDDNTAPENTLWEFRTNGGATNGRGLEMRWENGAGVDVIVQSIAIASWPLQGWFHVAAERYEVTPGFWGVRFYLNGVLVDDQNNGGSGWPPPDGGGNSLPNIACTESWNGGYREYFYDSVRVYDTAIGQSLIAADMAADIVGGQFGDGDGGVLKTDWPAHPLAPELVGVPGDHFPLISAGPLSTRENAGFSQ